MEKGRKIINHKPAKNAGGRPSKYKEEFLELAYNYCMLGATDQELAVFFNTSVRTINYWKNKQVGFYQALKRGKTIADAKVAAKLFERACGYEHAETKFFVVKDGKDSEKVVKEETTAFYPPDIQAATFWLKNRQPFNWRDQVIIDLSNSKDTLVTKDDKGNVLVVDLE